MNTVFYIAVAFALLSARGALQTVMPIPFAWFQPTLVVAIYLGLFKPGTASVFTVGFLGYLLDTFSGSQFGFHVITVSAVYFGTSLLRGRFFLESQYFRFVYVSCAVLAHDVVATLVFSLVTKADQMPALLFDDVVFRMLANGVLGVPLYAWLAQTEERWAPLTKRRKSEIAVD